MALLDMRREYEQIRNGWRSRPPAEHRFDLARLGELRTEAEESIDEGTEHLLLELEDLIAQIAHHRPQPHARQTDFNEPSDSM